MGYTIPTWDMLIEEKKKHRTTIVAAMGQRAKDLKITVDPSDLHTRDLRPGDLGLKSWVVTTAGGFQWDSWVRHIPPSTQVLCIYAVAHPGIDIIVSELRLGIGVTMASVLGLHDVSKLGVIKNLLQWLEPEKDAEWLKDYFGDLDKLRMEAYFTEPFVWSSGEAVAIDIKGNSPVEATGEFALYGFVAEPLLPL